MKNNQYMTAKDFTEDTYKFINQRLSLKKNLLGISTGFKLMDSIVSGFQEKDLVEIVRDDLDRNHLFMELFKNIALKEKIPCGFFSFNAKPSLAGVELIQMISDVPAFRIFSGMLHKEEFAAICDKENVLADAPFIFEKCFGMTITDLCEEITRLAVSENLKVIFIDSIDFLASGEKQNLISDFNYILKKLKELSFKLDIITVVSTENNFQNYSMNNRFSDIIITVKTPEQQNFKSLDGYRLEVMRNNTWLTPKVNVVYNKNYEDFIYE